MISTFTFPTVNEVLNVWPKKQKIDFFERDRDVSTQERDQLKNNYALQHHIPLVRIPYTKEKTICFNDIFGEEFLIKGDTNE